ncbi:hypothetical protein [Nocardia otitidiscaviarum]|uniref:hypothetical protein n=1 Tax=Nocardia otitidiscaviarum TaxID=1823 RepID=UPI0004A6DA0A|nr:hypothetical protein [Nocardia otitidiscaviarum]
MTTLLLWALVLGLLAFTVAVMYWPPVQTGKHAPHHVAAHYGRHAHGDTDLITRAMQNRGRDDRPHR